MGGRRSRHKKRQPDSEQNLSTAFTNADELGGFSKSRSEFIDSVMKMPKIAEQTVSDEVIGFTRAARVQNGVCL
jgi:hypothetical protein